MVRKKQKSQKTMKYQRQKIKYAALSITEVYNTSNQLLEFTALRPHVSLNQRMSLPISIITNSYEATPSHSAIQTRLYD
jgi:hypothetical protein